MGNHKIKSKRILEKIFFYIYGLCVCILSFFVWWFFDFSRFCAFFFGFALFLLDFIAIGYISLILVDAVINKGIGIEKTKLGIGKKLLLFLATAKFLLLAVVLYFAIVVFRFDPMFIMSGAFLSLIVIFIHIHFRRSFKSW